MPIFQNTPRRGADHLRASGPGISKNSQASSARLTDRSWTPPSRTAVLRRGAIRRRIYVEHWRKPPLARSHLEEAVVLQIIVLAGHENRKDQTPTEFTEIDQGMGRPHEIDNLDIRTKLRAVLPSAVRAEIQGIRVAPRRSKGWIGATGNGASASSRRVAGVRRSQADAGRRG